MTCTSGNCTVRSQPYPLTNGAHKEGEIYTEMAVVKVVWCHNGPFKATICLNPVNKS